MFKHTHFGIHSAIAGCAHVFQQDKVWLLNNVLVDLFLELRRLAEDNALALFGQDVREHIFFGTSQVYFWDSKGELLGISRLAHCCVRWQLTIQLARDLNSFLLAKVLYCFGCVLCPENRE
jgi:hypothetical protein